MDENKIREIICTVVTEYVQTNLRTVPIEVSARHVHLSSQHVEALFGKGYQLQTKRGLSQPGQYLCEERVKIVTAKAEIAKVAILGPVRKHTQVELSMTDARTLGLNVPLRQSGDLAGSADIYLVSNQNMVKAEQSVIVPKNHIHMTEADAARFDVQDRQLVKVRIQSSRPLLFENVIVRVNENSRLNMHIDFDEANACCWQTGIVGELIK
jgi:putative phosphotransacetylase